MTGRLSAYCLALTLGVGAVAALPLTPAATPALAQQIIVVGDQEIVLSPSQDLDDQELRTRVRVLRRLVRSGTRMVDGVRLRPILRADRAELKSRRAGGDGNDEQTADGGDDQPNTNGDDEVVMDDDQQEANTGGQNGNGDQAGSETSASSVRDILRDQRAPAELTDSELRQRIAIADSILETMQLSPRQKTRVEGFKNNDVAELNNRIEAQTGVEVAEDDPNQTARQLLRDSRRATDLSIDDLRERVAENRAVLAQSGLSTRNKQQLRDLLSQDRADLRERVAERQEARDQAREQAEADRASQLEAAQQRELSLRELLADRRPSERLGRAALTERIESLRTALKRDDLSSRERRILDEMLVSDRSELRFKLRQARDNRRANRPRANIQIEIAPRRDRPRRGNVALAEVFDEEIEEQLVAPPSREINRRYTIEEIRDEPSLRQLMPGIEIDTVRFGTNEDFVREEEIPQLDRLGETLERIIDSNPDEVFVIEGHTDAVGSANYNLGLSERRAEAVRQALLDYFLIPEDALEIAGFGEQFLKIPTLEAEEENRRVTVRRITPLVR